MADHAPRPTSPSTEAMRSPRIQPHHPSPDGEPKEGDNAADDSNMHRTATCRRGSSKSVSHARHKALEISSSSALVKSTPTPPLTAQSTSPPPANTMPSLTTRTSNGTAGGAVSWSDSKDTDSKRPVRKRATSASASKATAINVASRRCSGYRSPRGGCYLDFPPMHEPVTGPDVPVAPASGMYWSRAPVSGVSRTPLRAHSATLLGSRVFVFGGCDSRICFNKLYVADADSFHWTRPHVVGDIPVPLRAMTCTAVSTRIVLFGGGDGPSYRNDVYVLDTVKYRWHKPRITGDRMPSPRRAHAACYFNGGLFVCGGGDGVRALNDVWRLDVSNMQKMSWKLISPPTTGADKDVQVPKPRGYHTANMVGSKMILYGGSDGLTCFNDVWVFDVERESWRLVDIATTYRRLSHTATICGSYLFVIGGHDGTEYSNEVLLLNLVTMTWEKRRVYGVGPCGRGYHATVLYDSRFVCIGGFDGNVVYDDVWLLELAVHAYYSQISQFSIDV